MADIEILRHVAAKSGLGLKYLSKDEKISMALEQIRELFPEAILKGGTALNRVYLSKKGAGRFSEDIDLDYPDISAVKEKIFGLKGFNVQGPRLVRRIFRFDCFYANEFGDKDRIMIEFNPDKQRFVSAGDILVKSPFIEAHSCIFRVYSLEDLIAKKLLALNSRTEGKDIYDVFYALEFDFDRKKVFQALDFAVEDRGMFFKSILQKLKSAGENFAYIGNSTNHFIPASLRPDWKMFIGTLAQKIETIFGNSKNSVQ